MEGNVEQSNKKWFSSRFLKLMLMCMNKDKNKNGELYCIYLLVYVDAVFSIAEDADVPMKMMEKFLRLD